MIYHGEYLEIITINVAKAKYRGLLKLTTQDAPIWDDKNKYLEIIRDNTNGNTFKGKSIWYNIIMYSLI